MKTLINLLLLVPLLTLGQVFEDEDYKYFDFSFDANKAFKIKDNDRTVEDVYGLDFDLEAGLKVHWFGIYGFYGEFENGGFRNFGAGVDLYPNWFRWVDMSLGFAWSKQEQKDFRDLYEPVGWWAFRAVTRIYFSPDSPFGLSLRFNLQDRNDTSDGMVGEGAIGVTFRLK